MDNSGVYRMTFASVYPMYLQKVEKKWRAKAEGGCHYFLANVQKLPVSSAAIKFKKSKTNSGKRFVI